MAALQSSTLAKNAANLAAQLALVESRGREESMAKEKPESRPSTGTVVSASGDSINDSARSSKATSQPTSGHTSPTKVDDSVPTSCPASQSTTGHTSPTRLAGSTSTTRASSQVTTGGTSPTKLESETFFQEAGDGNTLYFSGGGAGEENFQGGTPNESDVLAYSVAEAVEVFEAKTTRTKKSKRNKISNQPRPHNARVEKRDRNEIIRTGELRTFGWAKFSALGLTMIGLCASIYCYSYISECIIIIKL